MLELVQQLLSFLQLCCDLRPVAYLLLNRFAIVAAVLVIARSDIISVHFVFIMFRSSGSQSAVMPVSGFSSARVIKEGGYVVPVPSGYGTSRLSWSVLPRSYSSPCFPESSSYVDCVHHVLRTLPAIIRPIPGIKPVSGHLVIIHLCIRASTHRLRSYQTFSSADYHYIGIGEEP